MVKIHPIHLRTEILHTFEVRNSKKGKWIKVKPALITSKGKTIRFTNKQGELKKGKRKDRNLYLSSKKKFRYIRIDKQEEFKVGSKPKGSKSIRGVNRVKLQRFFNRVSRVAKLSPVLQRIFEVRRWAAAKGLNVGGFPLPDEKVVRHLSPTPSKGSAVLQPLKEVIEGEQYQFRKDFLLELGLGEVWGDEFDDQEEGEVYVAFYTTNPFREYKGEGPRFYVGKKLFGLDTAGLERIEGKGNLETLNSFVFDTYGELSGTEQQLFPLGIVGVRYVG